MGVPWLESLLEQATSTRRAQRRWFNRDPRSLMPTRMAVLSAGRERRRRRFWEL
jgi:hypothetical protein